MFQVLVKVLVEIRLPSGNREDFLVVLTDRLKSPSFFPHSSVEESAYIGAGLSEIGIIGVIDHGVLVVCEYGVAHQREDVF